MILCSLSNHSYNYPRLINELKGEDALFDILSTLSDSLPPSKAVIVCWPTTSSNYNYNIAFTIQELSLHPSARTEIKKLFIDPYKVPAYKDSVRKLIFSMLRSTSTYQPTPHAISEQDLKDYIRTHCNTHTSAVYSKQIEHFLGLCMVHSIKNTSKKLIVSSIKSNNWYQYFSDHSVLSEKFSYLSFWHNYLKNVKENQTQRNPTISFLPQMNAPKFPSIPLASTKDAFQFYGHSLLDSPITPQAFHSTILSLYDDLLDHIDANFNESSPLKYCIAPSIEIMDNNQRCRVELVYIEHTDIDNILISIQKLKPDAWHSLYSLLEKGIANPYIKPEKCRSSETAVQLNHLPKEELINILAYTDNIFGLMLGLQLYRAFYLNSSAAFIPEKEPLSLLFSKKIRPKQSNSIDDFSSLLTNTPLIDITLFINLRNRLQGYITHFDKPRTKSISPLKIATAASTPKPPCKSTSTSSRRKPKTVNKPTKTEHLSTKHNAPPLPSFSASKQPLFAPPTSTQITPTLLHKIAISKQIHSAIAVQDLIETYQRNLSNRALLSQTNADQASLQKPLTNSSPSDTTDFSADVEIDVTVLSANIEIFATPTSSPPSSVPSHLPLASTSTQKNEEILNLTSSGSDFNPFPPLPPYCTSPSNSSSTHSPEANRGAESDNPPFFSDLESLLLATTEDSFPQQEANQNSIGSLTVNTADMPTEPPPLKRIKKS